ncbi:hypothetical protein, partial [Pseudomonas aeruginosa]
MLSNGQNVYKSQVDVGYLEDHNIVVLSERDTVRRQVRWYKLTAAEILEERDWPGRWIPVIPVYGAEYEIEGKVIRY